MGLPGIFDETIFSTSRPMTSSIFVRPMHPKTEILPTPQAIRKLLDAGWCGQLKIHGHRAQIHVHEDPSTPLICFNRQGKQHKKLLPPEIAAELRRLLQPTSGWNVIDAEWLKEENKLFLFDFIKFNNKLLIAYNYLERRELLPQVYVSQHISTLGIMTTVERCLAVFNTTEEHIEGLVFRSKTKPGFSDTSIIRCRRKPGFGS